MTLALIIAGTSFILLVLFSILTNRERAAGRRFLLSSVRYALDEVILAVTSSVRRAIVYVIRYVITLSWYYSLHAFLRVTLRSIASMYYMVERMTHSNRDRARKIRQERKQITRSHLDQLVDHKVDTKLTEQQKKRLKDKAINQK